jgi:hypothetical protein
MHPQVFDALTARLSGRALYRRKATGSRVLVFFMHELKAPPAGAKENLLLEYCLFVFVLIGKDEYPLGRQQKRSTLRWAGGGQTLERR